MTGCLSVIYDLVSQLFNFQLPWGISFGAVVVGVFGLPFLAMAFRKFF